MTPLIWRESHRADKESLPLADRHYNRQKIGAPQFVPPGRCVVLRSKENNALWVSSWPFAEYVKHAWAGAWINSLFRREGGIPASEMIRQAVAITRSIWTPPELGIVSFIDPNEVRQRKTRGRLCIGECYFEAGWKHVGYTKAGLHSSNYPARCPTLCRCRKSKSPAFRENNEQMPSLRRKHELQEHPPVPCYVPVYCIEVRYLPAMPCLLTNRTRSD